MGIFGGGTKNSNAQTTTVYDNRIAAQDSQIITGSSNTLNTNTTTYNTSSDYGAIAGAMEIANRSVAGVVQNGSTLAGFMKDGQANALDYGLKISNNAFDAINKNDNMVNELVKKNADLAQLAVGKVADSWKDAKTAEAGRDMGDFKYIVFGMIGVFALLAWRKRGA